MPKCFQCNRNVQVCPPAKIQREKVQNAVALAIQHYFSLDGVVSITRFDDMPFEWRSLNPSCDFVVVRQGDNNIYVEVKSSSNSFFHLTAGEINAVRKCGENYHVFVLYRSLEGNEMFYIFTGAGVLTLCRSMMLKLPLDEGIVGGALREYGPLVYNRYPVTPDGGW